MKKVTERTINSFRQSLGNTIKEIRDGKGITQDQLAEAIGTTQNRISEIETGKIKNIDTYIACVTALGGQLSITWK